MSDVKIERVPQTGDYHYGVTGEHVAEALPEHTPYGYSAPPSKGGRCLDCQRMDGGHDRDCGMVD